MRARARRAIHQAYTIFAQLFERGSEIVHRESDVMNPLAPLLQKARQGTLHNGHEEFDVLIGLSRRHEEHAHPLRGHLFFLPRPEPERAIGSLLPTRDRAR